MAVNVIFGETYSSPRGGSGVPLATVNVVFNTEEGEINKTFPLRMGCRADRLRGNSHYNNPNFPDSCGLNAEKWAAEIPVAIYTSDEQTADQSRGRSDRNRFNRRTVEVFQ